MRKQLAHIEFLFLALALLAGSHFMAGGAFAQTPAGTRIQNEAKATFRYKTGDADSLRSNRIETVVQSSRSLASSIALAAAREAIIGNGTDTVSLLVTVLDASGNPVPDGALVSLAASSGTFPQGKDTITLSTVRGIVSVPIFSALVVQQVVSATITAATMGVHNTPLTASAAVLFFPGALTGSVMSAYSGLPVAGAIVTATDPSQWEAGRDTTGRDGIYLIPVSTAGEYSHTIRARNRFGDVVQALFHTRLPVPAVGGIPPVGALNAISGNLVDRSTGAPLRQAGIRLSLQAAGLSKTTDASSLPRFCTTDQRGVFLFDSVSPGVHEVRVDEPGYAGTAVIHDTLTNCFVIDVALGLADIPTLEVTKTTNKRIAEIGDGVAYMLEIRNSSPTSTLTDIRIHDQLPLGFSYVKGSSRQNQAPSGDPSGARDIEWAIGDTLEPGKTARLSYMARIGAGAMEGDGVNHAFAIAQVPGGEAVRSAVASAAIVVRPGVFTDRGIVIGKVFNDLDMDGLQAENEPGIANVELWMEDGTHVVTGDDGKYSLPEVKPGQHVIRVDERTLPAGSVPLATRTDHAGDGSSRFIRLVEGGVARADFQLTPPRQACLATSVSAAPGTGQLHAMYIVQFHVGTPPSSIVLLDTVPQGLLFDLESVRINGSPTAGVKKRERILRVELPVHALSTDSVTVSILQDSSATGKNVTIRPRAVLSYPRRREALFVTPCTFVVPELLPPEVAEHGTLDSNKLAASVEETWAEAETIAVVPQPVTRDTIAPAGIALPEGGRAAVKDTLSGSTTRDIRPASKDTLSILTRSDAIPPSVRKDPRSRGYLRSNSPSGSGLPSFDELRERWKRIAELLSAISKRPGEVTYEIKERHSTASAAPRKPAAASVPPPEPWWKKTLGWQRAPHPDRFSADSLNVPLRYPEGTKPGKHNGRK